MTFDLTLANKAVLLNCLLEKVQALLDELRNTNMYKHEIKQTANALSKAVEKQLKTWYTYNVAAPAHEPITDEEKKMVQNQILYLKLAKSLDYALTSILDTNPTTVEIISV